MKVVIQKSGPANVKVNTKIVGQIEAGLVILLGINKNDTTTEADKLLEKVINLRLFESEEKHFEKSVLECGYEILLISQFTLYAKCKKGRRPDFIEAAGKDLALPLYEYFKEKLKQSGIKVSEGQFGEYMELTLTNQGPTTIIIDSSDI